MLVTPAGIEILVRLLQYMKDDGPRLDTLAEIVMFVKPLHDMKAPSPMDVTLDGIVTFVSS